MSDYYNPLKDLVEAWRQFEADTREARTKKDYNGETVLFKGQFADFIEWLSAPDKVEDKKV